MVAVDSLPFVLGSLSLAVALSTIPFTIAAFGYRDRDNGLAYLVLVFGVGLWNAMFVAQLLTSKPLVQVFFLALSIVGSGLAGLGFFLFASTASSTPTYLSRRGVYGLIAVLGGIDFVLAVTAPIHRFYWEIQPGTVETIGFAAVEPTVGYWLHTAFLVALFGLGAWLFYDGWRQSPENQFAPAYVLSGVATALAVAGSNVLAPGGLGVAPIAAVSLTSVGWYHASRGRPFAWIHDLVG